MFPAKAGYKVSSKTVEHGETKKWLDPRQGRRVNVAKVFQGLSKMLGVRVRENPGVTSGTFGRLKNRFMSMASGMVVAHQQRKEILVKQYLKRK